MTLRFGDECSLVERKKITCFRQIQTDVHSLCEKVGQSSAGVQLSLLLTMLCHQPNPVVMARNYKWSMHIPVQKKHADGDLFPH